MRDYSRDERYIQIASERLQVVIAKPGSTYRGTRFDWTGWIQQVVLDEKDTFCVPESYQEGQGTGGEGLCNEFGIFEAIGYEEATAGERFQKIGVGLLSKKNMEPYGFYLPYEVEPFDMHVSVTSDTVRFVVEPRECRGYALKLEKVISVRDTIMEISYTLKNTGSKPIDTQEYCHNFVGINENPIGPDYVLRFPYEILCEEIPEGIGVNGSELTWLATPSKEFYCRPRGYENIEEHVWELVHVPSGVGIREYSEFPVSLVALWGTTHVASLEVFIDIHLEPGQVKSWSRRYAFFYV